MLVRFMQENSLDAAHKDNLFDHGDRYTFGRPIREIFGALERLSGQKFDETQLYSVFSGGSPARQRLQSKLFERTAARWASWWEQHASEFIHDDAYAHVNLPTAKAGEAALKSLQPGMHFKTVPGGSNHVLQPVFDPKAFVVFHDLDTGASAGLPQKWRNAKGIESQLDEIIAWAMDEGFDLMGTEYTSPRDGRKWFAIRSIGLRAGSSAKNAGRRHPMTSRWKRCKPRERPHVTTFCCISSGGANRRTPKPRRLFSTSRVRDFPDFSSWASRSKTRMSKSASRPAAITNGRHRICSRVVDSVGRRLMRTYPVERLNSVYPCGLRGRRSCATTFRSDAIINASAYSTPMSRAPLRYS